MTSPPPGVSDFTAFRVLEQDGYKTSYDAVARLEELHRDLVMRNTVGRNGSSVLLPTTASTYEILDALTSNQLCEFVY